MLGILNTGEFDPQSNLPLGVEDILEFEPIGEQPSTLGTWLSLVVPPFAVFVIRWILVWALRGFIQDIM